MSEESITSQDKEELKRRLELLQREYERTAQRLQRAERREAVRKHVQNKIMEQHRLMHIDTTAILEPSTSSPEQLSNRNVSSDTTKVRFHLPDASPFSTLTCERSPSRTHRLRSKRSRLRLQIKERESDTEESQERMNKGVEERWRDERGEMESGREWTSEEKEEEAERRRTQEENTEEEENSKNAEILQKNEDVLMTLSLHSAAESSTVSQSSLPELLKVNAPLADQSAVQNSPSVSHHSVPSSQSGSESLNDVEKSPGSADFLTSCTLIEGLPFPVEYYVRTTRRMASAHSTVDLNAVIQGQLSKGRGRRRSSRGHVTSQPSSEKPPENRECRKPGLVGRRGRRRARESDSPGRSETILLSPSFLSQEVSEPIPSPSPSSDPAPDSHPHLSCELAPDSNVYPIFRKRRGQAGVSPIPPGDSSHLLPSLSSVAQALRARNFRDLGGLIAVLDVQDFHLPDEEFGKLKLERLCSSCSSVESVRYQRTGRAVVSEGGQGKNETVVLELLSHSASHKTPTRSTTQADTHDDREDETHTQLIRPNNPHTHSASRSLLLNLSMSLTSHTQPHNYPSLISLGVTPNMIITSPSPFLTSSNQGVALEQSEVEVRTREARTGEPTVGPLTPKLQGSDVSEHTYSRRYTSDISKEEAEAPEPANSELINTEVEKQGGDVLDENRVSLLNVITNELINRVLIYSEITDHSIHTVSPNAPPLSPNTPPLSPNAPPLSPNTPPLSPNAPPLSPNAPPLSPNAPPHSPNAPSLSPNAPPLSPNAPPLSPNAPPLTPNDPPFPSKDPLLSPNAPPLSPNAPPLSPNAPPLSPNAPPLSPNAPPLSPNAPPLSPNAPPLSPNAPPLSPNAPPLSPYDPPLSQNDPLLSPNDLPLSSNNPPLSPNDLPLSQNVSPFPPNDTPLYRNALPLSQNVPPHENDPPLSSNNPLLSPNAPPLPTNAPPLSPNAPPLSPSNLPLSPSNPPLSQNDPPLYQNDPLLLQNDPLFPPNDLFLYRSSPPLSQNEPPLYQNAPPFPQNHPPPSPNDLPLSLNDLFLSHNNLPLSQNAPPLSHINSLFLNPPLNTSDTAELDTVSDLDVYSQRPACEVPPCGDVETSALPGGSASQGEDSEVTLPLNFVETRHTHNRDSQHVGHASCGSLRKTHALKALDGGCVLDVCVLRWPSEDWGVCVAGEWSVCVWRLKAGVQQWSLVHTWTFTQSVISLQGIPDSFTLLCVCLGRLEITEARILYCPSTHSEFSQVELYKGALQAVLSVSDQRVVCCSAPGPQQNIQVFTLTQDGRITETLSLVSTHHTVQTLVVVERERDALIGWTEHQSLLIWNMKSGRLLQTLHLAECVSMATCLRGYSYRGALCVLLQQTNFCPSGTGSTLFTLIATNPLTGKCVPLRSIPSPSAPTERLVDGDVCESALVGVFQSGLAVWNLAQGVACMYANEAAEACRLARWAGPNTLLTGYLNGDVNIYQFTPTEN